MHVGDGIDDSMIESGGAYSGSSNHDVAYDGHGNHYVDDHVDDDDGMTRAPEIQFQGCSAADQFFCGNTDSQH
eukprot:7159462-Karenia_brevis.AAC.1